MDAIFVIWFLVMAAISGVGLWLSTVRKRKNPKGKVLRWAAEMFFPAFAIAPMWIGCCSGSHYIPAGWFIIGYLISCLSKTPQNMPEMMDPVASLFLTWAALWFLRALLSTLIHRKLPWKS